MYSLYEDKLSVSQSCIYSYEGKVREDDNKTSHFDFWLIQSQSEAFNCPPLSASLCVSRLQQLKKKKEKKKEKRANCEQIWHGMRKWATRTDEPVSDIVLQAK